MRWPVLLITCAMTTPLLRAGEWKKMTSPNFELFTTSSEREARQTLEVFERARDFFLRAKPASFVARLPVTIVAFDTAREYQPYSRKSFTPAYATTDEERDYVVMSDLGADRTRAAIHEYVHLLVRDSGYLLPIWLNEGMADVYSTLDEGDGKVYIGAIPRDRNYSLTHDDWIRLPILVNVGQNSKEYNEQERADIFYGESWLLAHMLMLGEGYSAKFPQFLDQFLSSTFSQAAFSAVYGKTLAEVEADMRAYFRQNTIGGAAYRLEFQKADVRAPQPASDLETGLVLARLVALLGRADEAQRRLDDLAANHPNNPDIEDSLAYLAWRKGDREAARSDFEKAFADGATTWKTQWDYARLLTSLNSDTALRQRALRRSLELKPDFTDARLMLADELYVSGQFAESLAELRRIENVDPRHATAKFAAMAYASNRLNQPEDARQYAEQAQKSVRTAVDSALVDRLMRDLQRNAAPPAVEVPADLPAAPAAVEDPGRPTLRRRSGNNRKN